MKLKISLPWYRKQGYTDKFILLPDGLYEGSSLVDIQKVLQNEYNKDEYRSYTKLLKLKLDSHSLEPLKLLIGFRRSKDYKILLTKYGSSGSYDAKTATIIVNIILRNIDKSIGTVVHEIIHIVIQHLIDEYAIAHWHKERLVDLIQEKLYPGMRTMQHIKQNTSVVDMSFEKFFPNIKNICQEINHNLPSLPR